MASQNFFIGEEILMSHKKNIYFFGREVVACFASWYEKVHYKNLQEHKHISIT